MCKAATDGAAVADREMSNMSNRILQQWRMACYLWRFQQIDVARQRTNGERAFPNRNPPCAASSSSALKTLVARA